MSLRDIDNYMVAGGKVWTAEHIQVAVLTGASLKIGFVTGTNQLAFLRRQYTSAGSLMTVNLYEVAFTGGANITRTYNRNLGSGGSAPAQMKAGVTFTPNTIVASLTARAVAGTNKAELLIPEDNPLLLKRNTSYVLEFVNGDNASADIGFTINFRDVQPGDYPV